MNRFLYRLERMIKRVAIHNLMLYVTGGMLLVFLLDFLLPALRPSLAGAGISIRSLLDLDRAALFQGQVWRLITYIFLPPSASALFIIFALYFYYMIGTNLERQWGAAKFNLYYIIGMLGTTVAALLTGYGTNMYLNLSLFFAFAVLFPDMQVLLFFVLPIKIKYLAYLDAAFFAISLILALVNLRWYEAAAIAASLLNFFLFFGGDFFTRIKEQRQYSATRRNFRRQMDNNRWR